jgi:hypothetical protein
MNRTRDTSTKYRTRVHGGKAQPLVASFTMTGAIDAGGHMKWFLWLLLSALMIFAAYGAVQAKRDFNNRIWGHCWDFMDLGHQ